MQKSKKQPTPWRSTASFLTVGLVCAVFMLGIWGLGGFSLAITPPCHAAAIAMEDEASAEIPEDSTDKAPRPKVILDAGHGGEDGGAVSANGVAEKTLNLSITMRLGTMLEAAGVEVIYTRMGDDGLYEGATKGHHKMTDLKNRLAIAKSYPDAIFLSLHMNTFQMEKYHGTQLFYSKNREESKTLATLIQTRVKEQLQPENTRAPKGADTSIYLLAQNDGIAVLAECGFLSNEAEAARLGDAVYQEKLAAVMCASVLEFLYAT